MMKRSKSSLICLIVLLDTLLHIGYAREANGQDLDYKAAGTKDEDKVFDQYRKITGISSWDEIMFSSGKSGGN